MASHERFRSEFDAQLIASTERIRHGVVEAVRNPAAAVSAELADNLSKHLEHWIVRASVTRGFSPKPETIKLLVRSFDFSNSVGMAIQTDVEPIPKQDIPREAYELFLCDLVDHERSLRCAAEKKLGDFTRLVRWLGFKYCSYCERWGWLLWHRCLWAPSGDRE